MQNKIRNFALVIGGAAILLSASTAFAQQPGVMMRYNDRNENRGQNSGSFERDRATTTNRMMERDQERRDEMRQKAEKQMEQIEDKQKQRMAVNLSRQFDNLNQTWTRHFMQLLDRYTAILQKVKDRASAAAAAGKDVSKTNAAIASAQTAITTARTAVAAQQAKTFVINLSVASSTITTATSTPTGQDQMMKGLRNAFQVLHKQLFDSLTALRDGAMQDARKAVQGAIQSLGQVPGVDEVHATSTATSTKND